MYQKQNDLGKSKLIYFGVNEFTFLSQKFFSQIPLD